MGMNKSDLKRAFRESVSNEFQNIPRNESQIDYEFSNEFETKMSKLIRSEKKKSWHWFNTPYKRVALIVAILMMMFITACSVPAIREGIVNFIINTFDIEHKVDFEGDTKDIIEQIYQPSFLPEEFEKTAEHYSDVTTYISYSEKNSDNQIIFSQSITSNSDLGIDNEQGELKEDSVSGYEVYWYERTNEPKQTSAFWIQDGYLITLTWDGDFDKETMIKMIESVEPIE